MIDATLEFVGESPGRPHKILHDGFDRLGMSGLKDKIYSDAASRTFVARNVVGFLRRTYAGLEAGEPEALRIIAGAREFARNVFTIYLEHAETEGEWQKFAEVMKRVMPLDPELKPVAVNATERAVEVLASQDESIAAAFLDTMTRGISVNDRWVPVIDWEALETYGMLLTGPVAGRGPDGDFLTMRHNTDVAALQRWTEAFKEYPVADRTAAWLGNIAAELDARQFTTDYEPSLPIDLFKA